MYLVLETSIYKFFFLFGWWTKSLIYNEKWLFHQATILRWMFRGIPVAVTAVFFLVRCGVRCGVTAIISDQGSWQERVLQAPASSVGHWSWLILASGLATKNDLKQQTPPSFLIVFVSLLQSLLSFWGISKREGKKLCFNNYVRVHAANFFPATLSLQSVDFTSKTCQVVGCHRCHLAIQVSSCMLNHFASWIQRFGTTKQPPELCCVVFLSIFLWRKEIQDKTPSFFFHLLLGQWLVAGAWALGVVQNAS